MSEQKSIPPYLMEEERKIIKAFLEEIIKDSLEEIIKDSKEKKDQAGAGGA